MEPEYITRQKERLARITHLYIYEEDYAVTDEDMKYTKRYDEQEPSFIFRNIDNNIIWIDSHVFKLPESELRITSAHNYNPRRYYYFEIDKKGVKMKSRSPHAIIHVHNTGNINFYHNRYRNIWSF